MRFLVSPGIVFGSLRRRAAVLMLLALALAGVACADGEAPAASQEPIPPVVPTGTIPGRVPTDSTLPARRFWMGFSAIPPRLTDSDILWRTVAAWLPRADAAILQSEVPWAALLAGETPTTHVRRESVPLASYYRANGLVLVVAVDPLNSGVRDIEAFELLAAGRSVTEPAIQQLYRSYVVALARETRPDYLVLALETNLVRAVAPAAVYAALRTMVNAAAADLRREGVTARLGVSFQVETAWGLLPRETVAANPVWGGVASDRAHFAFMEFTGLSAYPHIGGFSSPAAVPADYYARMAESPALPLLVVEGGWGSNVGRYWSSTPDMQAQWISRQAALLDSAKAVAVFQLNYTDLDPAGYVVGPGVDLTPYLGIGLVDVSFQPKPAMASWDRVFARPRR